MKIISCLFVFLLSIPLFGSESELSFIDDMCNKLTENNLFKLAIYVESVDSLYRCEQFTDYFENEIIKKIQNKTNKIKCVERNILIKIVNEQLLQCSGLFDDESVVYLGHLSGAQAILYIKYSELKNKTLINGKTIDVENGEIINVFNESLHLNSNLKEMLKYGVYYFFATGIGQAQDNPNLTDSIKRQMAKRAAELDAKRNLIEEIKGTYLRSHTEIENLILTEDKITVISSAHLRNVEIINVNYLDDGSAEVKVLLKLTKKEIGNIF